VLWTIYGTLNQRVSRSLFLITVPLYFLFQFLAIQTYWPLIKQKKLERTHNCVSSTPTQEDSD